MPFGLSDVSQGVADYLQDGLNRAGPLAVGETGKLLRDGVPTPGYIIPGIGVEIGRDACKRYADNAGAFDGGIGVQFENLCRPYLDDIGYGAPPSIELPFRGGQCVGAVYRLEFSFTNDQGTRQAIEQITTTPLVGTFIDPPDGLGRRSIGYLTREPGGGTQRQVQATITDPARSPNPRVRIVRREDGGLDNCGNVPPVVTPPGAPAAPLPPGPRPFNPGPGIDIDIDVDIEVTGPTGPTIIFDIGDGPVVVPIFGGGDNSGGGDDGGGAPGSGLPPGDIGTPAAPVGTPAGGSASGCAPPNSVLVGIKIDIIMAPAFGSEYDPLVRRGVCYAYMGTVGNLALEPSGVALRSGQMLFAPLDNLTCWEVRANTGYILRITPYYRALEAQEV